MGACADHRLRDHELLLRRVHRARPGDRARRSRRRPRLGDRLDLRRVRSDRRRTHVGAAASAPAAVVRLRRFRAGRGADRRARRPAAGRRARRCVGRSAWRRSRSATPTGRRTCSARIPRGVFARVRSYDILVSFVFMPLGFIVFPLIARSLGNARTLLAAAIVAAVTSLAVALRPGVRAIDGRARGACRACSCSRTRPAGSGEPGSAELRLGAYALAGVRFLFGM